MFKRSLGHLGTIKQGKTKVDQVFKRDLVVVVVVVVAVVGVV